MVSFIRSFIFTLIYFVFAFLCYWLLDIFCAYALLGIGKIQHMISPYIFWPLLFIIGFSIVRALWNILKIILYIISKPIIRISKANKYITWFSTVSVFINLGLYIYIIWWGDYDTSSFFGICVCIVVTFMGLGLGKVLTMAVDHVIIQREVEQSPFSEYLERID